MPSIGAAKQALLLAQIMHTAAYSALNVARPLRPVQLPSLRPRQPYGIDATATRSSHKVVLRAAAEASEAGYYRIVADVSTYKKNAAKQQESVAEVAKADAFRIFDKVLLAFEEARAEPPSDDDEAKVHSDFELISSGLLEQFKLLGLEEFEASAGDAYEPWRHLSLIHI